MLTLAVFLPIGAAVLIALLGRGARNVRIFAAAVSVVEFLLTFFIFLAYDTSDGASQFQLVDRVADWIPIPSFEVQYFLAVDGLSAPLVMLAGLLGMVAIFASWSIEHRVREYFVWLLALQGAVVGVFTSLDFLLFFVFWELELIPMFFLISIWGSGRREYSAMKFLIFTILGSAFMLVGILILYFTTGSFDMTEMPTLVRQASSGVPALLVFLLLFVAFAVKLPVWPLHTWLPDAHTDAPTAASVMLAGVLLKMGAYGMFRLGGILPDVLRDVSWALAALGVINILYGAAVVLRQTDMKRLIAFSSISHMGFVLLGLSSAVGVAGSVSSVGLTGASLQMFTHGAITGLLFLLVGYVYERAHTTAHSGPGRAGRANAYTGCSAAGRRTGVAGAAIDCRIRLRNPRLYRNVPCLELDDRSGRFRSGPNSRIHSVDGAASYARSAQPSVCGPARRDTS